MYHYFRGPPSGASSIQQQHPASSSGASKKPPIVLHYRTIGSFFVRDEPTTTQVTARQSVGRPSSAPRLQPLCPDVGTRCEVEEIKGEVPNRQQQAAVLGALASYHNNSSDSNSGADDDDSSEDADGGSDDRISGTYI